VLRWLTRLFGQRDEAETAPAAPLPLETPPVAAVEPTPSEAAAVAVAEPVDAPTAAEPVETLTLVELPDKISEVDAKETCPNCGRTSVFAGPPGQRFCTYCALRDELFERSAAATE
jgi:hypothetical protein